MSSKKDAQTDAPAGGAKKSTAIQGGGQLSAQQPTDPFDIFRIFDDAYRHYTIAVQKAWSPEDVRQSVEDAQRNYLQGLLETLSPDLGHKRVQVLQRFNQEMREAWLPETARRRFEKAFHNYLRELKKAWDQLKVDDIDPQTLARVSQSIFAGAGLAGNTVAPKR